jgi:hypothetical protein
VLGGPLDDRAEWETAGPRPGLALHGQSDESTAEHRGLCTCHAEASREAGATAAAHYTSTQHQPNLYQMAEPPSPIGLTVSVGAVSLCLHSLFQQQFSSQK